MQFKENLKFKYGINIVENKAIINKKICEKVVKINNLIYKAKKVTKI